MSDYEQLQPKPYFLPNCPLTETQVGGYVGLKNGYWQWPITNNPLYVCSDITEANAAILREASKFPSFGIAKPNKAVRIAFDFEFTYWGPGIPEDTFSGGVEKLFEPVSWQDRTGNIVFYHPPEEGADGYYYIGTPGPINSIYKSPGSGTVVDSNWGNGPSSSLWVDGALGGDNSFFASPIRENNFWSVEVGVSVVEPFTVVTDPDRQVYVNLNVGWMHQLYDDVRELTIPVFGKPPIVACGASARGDSLYVYAVMNSISNQVIELIDHTWP